MTRLDLYIAIKLIPQLRIRNPDAFFLRPWDIPIIKQWFIRGEHRYHYGVDVIQGL